MKRDEHIIVGALCEGSREAYEQLFVEWYEPLCRYACSILRDMDEAEESVQKMFCNLWDKREETRINLSIKSYLYRAVHNACINRIKHTKMRAGHHEQYRYAKPDTEENAAWQLQYGELEKAVAEAIQTLPPKCREVFEMSRMQQLSYAEIAEQLQISANTVENHMAKALRLLRNELKDFLPAVLFLMIFSTWK